jgi:SAM-dependent methyltransferase
MTSSRRPRRRSSPADRRPGGLAPAIPAVYDGFARDYHWLHDDVQLRLGTATPGVRAAFHGLPGGARVLDAACGVGLDAIALHRRGFDVTAVDASPAMLGEARRRLAAAQCDVDAEICTWAELSTRFATGPFDAVLCTGNSIAHARSRTEMETALRSFAGVLVPGGVLIIDTHHWEEMERFGDHVVVDPVVVERDGARCERTYTWRRVEAGSGRPWRLDLGLEISRGPERRERHLEVELFPFSTGELRERLRASGFTHISIDATTDSDRYTAVARRAGERAAGAVS